MNFLTVSPSPHLKGSQTTEKIMYGVVFAMIPAILVSFIFFGLGAIKVTLFCILSCLFFEYVIQKFVFKIESTITDGSALITGILLAFNLPSNFPIWMIIVGSAVAIGIGKMSFGGLGSNPFNPALVGRVFLLISFPVQMTSWPKPISWNFGLSSLDGETGATALGIMKEGLNTGQTSSELLNGIPSYLDSFLGFMGGSIGEISALALIVGGGYMLYKKIISWHIPVSFIVSLLFLATIFWGINPDKFASPLFHLFTGGLILGAFFMATDMVTSPMTPTGMIIFGIGCGVLTILIRTFGAYPEGVSFAILIMNSITPLLNKYIKPKRFGKNNGQ